MDKKVVIISGGSRGLGQTLTSELLEQGHILATFSRSETPFVTENLQRHSDNATFIWQSVDASQPTALKSFVDFVAKRHGRIDALINNAGILQEGPLALMRPEGIQQVLDVNLGSAINLTRLCTRVMLRQHRGVIVNISSVNGLRGFRGLAVYSATKAGLDGMTRTLARELGPRGIRVNSIAPGYFESEMTHGMGESQRDTIVRRTPLHRLGRPEDIAGVVRFLLSEDAGFMTGQTIVVDGGLTC